MDADDDADDGVQVYKVMVMMRWMRMLMTACRCTRWW